MDLIVAYYNIYYLLDKYIANCPFVFYSYFLVS